MLWFVRNAMLSMILGLLLAPLAVGHVHAQSARPAAAVSPDDMAKFLAGMAPPSGSPLAELARDGEWRRHADRFDGAWRSLEQRQLSRIRAWGRQTGVKAAPVMYYMFSGPDFLYADAFLPNATTYVMAGLEPVGRLPEQRLPVRGSIGSSLREIEVSLNTILSVSFFRTIDMRSRLRSNRLDGTLPLLYVFLARAGKTIHEVSLIGLDLDGTVRTEAEGGDKSTAKGVRIVCSAAGDETRRTLYYFSTDISNGGLARSGFLAFCEKLDIGDSLVKSASYLMHSGAFSKIRDFLLEYSQMIVQDDSGIPAAEFPTGLWELRPYGNYLGPIGLFPGRYQARLRSLFATPARRPLDFGIGYRWRNAESNLLLAVKRDAPEQRGGGTEVADCATAPERPGRVRARPAADCQTAVTPPEPAVVEVAPPVVIAPSAAAPRVTRVTRVAVRRRARESAGTPPAGPPNF